MSEKDYVGIVLAGGKSSRMGRDKSTLTHNGKTFLEIQVDKLKTLDLNKIIVSGKDFSVPGTLPVPDIIEDKGPLGGMYSCFEKCHGCPALVISVDVPLISPDTLGSLLEAYEKSDCDAVLLSYKDRPEPLIAVYNTHTSHILKDLIDAGDLAVSSFLSRLRCKAVFFKGNPQELLNCNSPADLDLIFKKS
ncbi:MAG: molybdenum cofactor guanylyltransferase [Lachnospiraceae bacterium]|jgi:molybdopterin-guanine dinucleotide biosynthesis protein A|nr:molybdenum cofactor guanylyltransferase [Lachnospiraceae bacterium]